jgi:hypothetical protein
MKGRKMTKAVEAKQPCAAQKTIVIKDGKPSPADIYVLPRAVVRFTNEDPKDYVIRLFADGGETVHAIVELFLGAFESSTFVAGLSFGDDHKRDCKYLVIEAPAASIAVSNDAPKKALAKAAGGHGGSGGSGTVHVGGN